MSPKVDEHGAVAATLAAPSAWQPTGPLTPYQLKLVWAKLGHGHQSQENKRFKDVLLERVKAPPFNATVVSHIKGNYSIKFPDTERALTSLKEVVEHISHNKLPIKEVWDFAKGAEAASQHKTTSSKRTAAAAGGSSGVGLDGGGGGAAAAAAADGGGKCDDEEEGEGKKLRKPRLQLKVKPQRVMFADAEVPKPDNAVSKKPRMGVPRAGRNAIAATSTRQQQPAAAFDTAAPAAPGAAASTNGADRTALATAGRDRYEERPDPSSVKCAHCGGLLGVGVYAECLYCNGLVHVDTRGVCSTQCPRTGDKNESGTTCNHCSLLLGVVNTTLCGCCQQFVHACNVCRSRCTAAGTSD